MQKFFTLILVLFLALGLKAQDVVVLSHTNYTTHFSKSKKYPVMVEWWETKAKIGCPTPLPRKDNFKPDPKLPIETNIGNDYINSGYDRGHLMPAKSNQCQTQSVQDECFYYSNMVAQTHRLNAGDWKSLETLTREWAVQQDSVRIWAGNVGEIKKIGSVSVPKQCWKVIHIKKSNEWFFFLFENDQSKPDGINNNKVTREDIEKLTGFKFK
jgi:endonuclease G, mitochondrial